jgi:hypothetical protein
VPEPRALVLCERQAPEHSKTPMFYKMQFEYLMLCDALSYRSWLETLAAYISFPCPANML